MNHKKLRRLYAEEGLQGRRRGGRKRALGTRAPMAIPQGPDQRWSLDFLSDALVDGRRFRIFAVVDDFTRDCLCLVADTSLSGLRVARELDAVIVRRGRPAMCVSDNGTQMTNGLCPSTEGLRSPAPPMLTTPRKPFEREMPRAARAGDGRRRLSGWR